MPVLTSEQIERFHKDGYLRFQRVIDDSAVTRMREALDHALLRTNSLAPITPNCLQSSRMATIAAPTGLNGDRLAQFINL